MSLKEESVGVLTTPENLFLWAFCVSVQSLKYILTKSLTLEKLVGVSMNIWLIFKRQNSTSIHVRFVLLAATNCG